ncbi:MAG: helix-turn-helix domain-containing protein [Ruminococcus sp.]
MVHIKVSNSVIEKRRAIISKLVKVRVEKGISQTQLAKLSGMHRSNICRIESGNQNLSLDTLIRLSMHLGKISQSSW